MKVFSKDVIESFAKPGNEKVASKTSELICTVVYNALIDMSKTNPYIDPESLDFEFVNEFITGSYGPYSVMHFYASIISPQLEFNTVKLIDRKLAKFLNRLTLAWQNRSPKKKRKREKKRRKKEKEQNSALLIAEGKYTMENFFVDLQNTLLNYLDTTTVVYRENQGLRIVGRDEFAYTICITPVIKNETAFKIFDSYKREFKIVDYKDRIKNNLEREKKIGGNYISMLRILNSLYYNVTNNQPDAILIESLLASVPEELFKGGVYEVFLKVINYLNLVNFADVKSIADNQTLLFSKKSLSKTSYMSAHRFIRDVASRV